LKLAQGRPGVAPSRRYDPETLRQEVRELVAEAGRELLRPPSSDESERVLPNAWMVPPTQRTNVARACNVCLDLAELGPLQERLPDVPRTPQYVTVKLDSDEGIQELVGAPLPLPPQHLMLAFSTTSCRCTRGCESW